MTGRSVEQILAEWRSAEAAVDPNAVDPHLVERIERLRLEYSEAVAARHVEADDLRRNPGDIRHAQQA